MRTRNLESLMGTNIYLDTILDFLFLSNVVDINITVWRNLQNSGQFDIHVIYGSHSFSLYVKCSYKVLTPLKNLDSDVQSIVSLTISLRHKFVKQISAKVTNTLLFFVEKI